MTYPCRDYEDRLIARTDDRSDFEADLAQHVNGCANCAAFAQRAGRRILALRSLERRVAPVELDGRAVAACHGGHRQDRTISHVRALTRWNVPVELEAKIVQGERAPDEASHAPSVLERLVDEDLHDQPKALARRYTGRLERLRAPGVLRVRVERTTEKTTAFGGRRLRFFAAASLVCLLLLLVGGGIYWLEQPRYSFEIVQESSIEGLDPLGRSLLDSLTGGMTDAYGTKR